MSKMEVGPVFFPFGDWSLYQVFPLWKSRRADGPLFHGFSLNLEAPVVHVRKLWGQGDLIEKPSTVRPRKTKIYPENQWLEVEIYYLKWWTC